MELKRAGLTFIRKGRLRSSSYSSCCHLPFHLPLLQNSSCQYRGILLHQGISGVFIQWQQWNGDAFNGKSFLFWVKTSPSFENWPFLLLKGWPSFPLMISDQLYSAINLSEPCFYCIFSRCVRELPNPTLQRSDIFRRLVPFFFLRRGIWPNRFSVLCQTCCQDRSPYECSDLKTGIHLWFGGILSDTLDSTSP